MHFLVYFILQALLIKTQSQSTFVFTDTASLMHKPGINVLSQCLRKPGEYKSNNPGTLRNQ